MNFWIFGSFLTLLGIGIYNKNYLISLGIKNIIKIIGYLFVLKKKFKDRFLKNDLLKITNINVLSQDLNLITEKCDINLINYNSNLIYQINYIYHDRKYTIFFDKNNGLEQRKKIFNNGLLTNNLSQFTQGADDIILAELESDDKDFSIKYDENDLEQTNTVMEIIKKFSGPKGNFYKDISFYNFNDKYLKNELKNYLNLSDIKLSIMYSNGDIINY